MSACPIIANTARLKTAGYLSLWQQRSKLEIVVTVCYICKTENIYRTLSQHCLLYFFVNLIDYKKKMIWLTAHTSLIVLLIFTGDAARMADSTTLL